MMKEIFALLSIILSSFYGWGQSEPFNVPMRFSVIGDGVEQLPLEFEYNLESQKALRIGDAIVSYETFNVSLGSLHDLSEDLSPFLHEEDRNQNFLVVRWPTELIDEGTVEAIGHSGRVLWSSIVRKSDILDWRRRLKVYDRKMSDRLRRDEIDAIPLMSSTWAFKNFVKSAEEFINGNESFRFCVSRLTDEGQTRICTGFMSFAKRQRRWILQRNPEPEKPARVIAFQKLAPLRSRVRIKNFNLTFQFLAEMSSGLIYEFVSKPPKLELVELVKVNDSEVKLVGFGQTPARDFRVINPSKPGTLTRILKWQQTIGDFREYWETVFPLAEPIVYFNGPGGGIFRQGFKILRLPKEASRPFLHRLTPDSTYINGMEILGQKASGTQLLSHELRLVEGSSGDFQWSFQALEKGDLNRAHVIVDDSGQKFRAYYETFKGYSAELSVRLSAVLGSTIFLNGEGAFNYWFEDLFGWTHYWLARQRWGVSAKGFNSLTPYKLKGGEDIGDVVAPLRTMTFDLKYRLTPGLWNRDESWGGILGVYDIRFSYFGLKALGVGFFWARSMPRLFDDLFNSLGSMFQYPKWVDLEFIIYPLSLNPSESTINLNASQQAYGTWSLNFHGKIHWTKSFFGEAGFGIRSIAFDQLVGGTVFRQQMSLLALYGTGGIGYQF